MLSFTQPLKEMAEFEEIEKSMEKKQGIIQITGCLESQKAHLIHGLSQKAPWRLVIAGDERQAKEICEDLRFYDKKTFFYPATEDENEQEEKQATDIDFNIGKTVDKLPYAVPTDMRYQYDIVLCSRTMAEKLTQKTQYRQGGLTTYFKTTDHTAVYEQMQKILKDNGQYFRYSLVDEAMEYESYRSIIYVVKVFSYGFLVLMSLIAMANVFNTISTNMMLRRREFAMLKSIGMTEQGFGKMLYFECLMYGSKALIYGIPVSVLISVWIAKTINNVQVLVLDIPWTAILISVLSVYFIVFVTMIYSKKKLQKLNLIGCIKEENI